jgi:hypothetical protein
MRREVILFMMINMVVRRFSKVMVVLPPKEFAYSLRVIQTKIGYTLVFFFKLVSSRIMHVI